MRYVLFVSWTVAVILVIRRRHAIAHTLRAMPVRYRVLVAVLLIACACIPGPVDDVIVALLLMRLTRTQSDAKTTPTRDVSAQA